MKQVIITIIYNQESGEVAMSLAAMGEAKISFQDLVMAFGMALQQAAQPAEASPGEAAKET